MPSPDRKPMNASTLAKPSEMKSCSKWHSSKKMDAVKIMMRV